MDVDKSGERVTQRDRELKRNRISGFQTMLHNWKRQISRGTSQLRLPEKLSLSNFFGRKHNTFAV